MAGPAYAPAVPGPSEPVMTREQELAALKNQVKYLEQALEDLRGRIHEAESPEEGSKA